MCFTQELGGAAQEETKVRGLCSQLCVVVMVLESEFSFEEMSLHKRTKTFI